MLKIAHRGGAGRFGRIGENTIPVARYSLRQRGIDGCEIDVRTTADFIPVPVLMHRRKIDYTTNGTGYIKDLRLSDLRGVDAGFGADVPTLWDFLTELRGFEKLFFIELKVRGIAERIKDVVCQAGVRENVFMLSGDADDKLICSDSAWDELNAFVPEFKVSLSVSIIKYAKLGKRNFINEAANRGAQAVTTSFAITTPGLINLAHENGLKVFVWTVNSYALIKYFKSVGVDGIISDFPERLNAA